MEGFIKLHRQILDWEWYSDTVTKSLFLHCLLKANYTEKQWKGNTVKRGQFITSLATLAQETNLSVQNIRTSLNKLTKSTHELTYQTTSHYTVITVNNYDKYQEVTSQLTNNQQATNKQLTTTKNNKKEKKEKNNTYEVDIILKRWNEIFGTKVESTLSWKNNYEKWREQFTLEQILEAISNIPKHDWLRTIKVTPTKFFRTDKDWIDQCLNFNKGKVWDDEFNLPIIRN